MTQAEEIAFWEGFAAGRSRDSIGGPDCRYRDPGLADAYGRGFAAGNAELRGDPWRFPAMSGDSAASPCGACRGEGTIRETWGSSIDEEHVCHACKGLGIVRGGGTAR